MTAVDYAQAGLLDGLTGPARESRLALLTQLTSDGVSLDELRRAVAEDRLVLIPVQRALIGEPRYSQREAAALLGVEVTFLQRLRAALGAPVADPDEPSISERELETNRNLAPLLALGIPDDAVLEVARTVGMAMFQVAETLTATAAEILLEPGVDEAELAARFAGMTQAMLPSAGPIFDGVLRFHLGGLVGQYVVTAAERASGAISAQRELTVMFADLVGFTRLGEQLTAAELTGVAEDLARSTAELAEPPARLVKTIGDAVMVVSDDPEPLVELTVSLIERYGDRLRAGIAQGSAVHYRGDVYGWPVNVASRICGIAAPGTAWAMEEIAAALEPARFGTATVGTHGLKNVEAPLALRAVTRA